MRKLRFADVFKGTFFRVSFFSGISAITRLITSFLLGKIIAVHLGPSGLGLMGQLSNFITIVLVLGGTAFSNGIVKYVSQYYKESPERIPALVSTSFKLTILFSLITSLLLVALSVPLSSWILFDKKYFFLFIIFGAVLIFSSLNSVILAIVNGRKDFKKFNILSISGNIIALAYSSLLIIFGKVNGALISLVTTQVIIFLISVIGVRKENWFSKHFLWQAADERIVKNLMKFFALGLVSSLLSPIVLLLIRNMIIKDISVSAAGFWELTNRISAMYLMFFSLTLTTYYLPRFSEITARAELYRELRKLYLLMIPLLCVTAILIYILRDFVIVTFFSKEFMEATQLFKFQLLGDILKISSWILGFQLLAKALIKVTIFTELFFNLIYFGTSYFFLKWYGLIGVSYAYFLSYLIYLPSLIIIVRLKLKNFTN